MEREHPSKPVLGKEIEDIHLAPPSLYDSLWEDGFVLQSALFDEEPQFIPTIESLLDVGTIGQRKIVTDTGEDYVLYLREEEDQWEEREWRDEI